MDGMIKFYVQEMFKEERGEVSEVKEEKILFSEESEKDKLSFSIKIPVKAQLKT